LIPSIAGARGAAGVHTPRREGSNPSPATTSLNGSPGRGLAFFLLARGMLRVVDGAAALAFRCAVRYWRWRKSHDPRFTPPFETSTVVTFVPELAGVAPGWETE